MPGEPFLRRREPEEGGIPIALNRVAVCLVREAYRAPRRTRGLLPNEGGADESKFDLHNWNYTRTDDMPVQTIRDVLGDPDSWPNLMPVSGDAVIVDVIASDGFDQIVVETRSSSGGLTYSTFQAKPAEMRRAIVRVLRPRTTVEQRDAIVRINGWRKIGDGRN